MSDMGNRFCTQCGTEIVNGACPKCSQAQQADNAERFKQFFMNPKEQFVCALGNGYIQNYLAGGFVGKGFAVVSDKRVYFKGKRYTTDGNGLRSVTVANSIELKNITGVNIGNVFSLALRVFFTLAVCLFIFIIVMTIIDSVNQGFDRFFPYLGTFIACLGVPLGTPSIVSYLATKKKLLFIEYTGGSVALEIKWYSKEEINSFLKALIPAKDKAIQQGTNDGIELPIIENGEKYKRFFMNPKENYVCALGNGYIQKFLANGSIGNGFSVVSDKRVYFNGKIYEVHNSRLKATSESRTVDLKDVTGTGVRAIKYPLLLIAAIVSAVLFITLIDIVAVNQNEFGLWGVSGVYIAIFLGVALLVLPFRIAYNTIKNKGFMIAAITIISVGMIGSLLVDILAFEQPLAFFITISFLAIPAALLIGYFRTRKTILTISYAGGCIAFDINWYSKEESDGFQKMLRIAKDKAVEDAENATANAMREVVSSVVGAPVQPVQSVQPQAPASNADELMKYAQLFKDGLLSEEEFAAIKAKML